jgi:RNA polymerase-binding transcription factor DksA
MPVDTNAIKETLQSERDSLHARLLELGARPHGDGVEIELDENFADSAASTAERAEILALVGSLRDTLTDVDAALARIEAGTYGRCESCGNDIAPARLEALPHARLCISCQQKRA